MRKSLAFVIVLAAACGKDPTTGMMGGPDSSTDATPAFEIKTTDIALPAGTEFTKCFYFHTPNTATVPVNKWISDLTPGSHHMIMFLTPGNSSPPPDGTIDENCGFGNSASNIPVWTFASAQPHLEADLPTDDGTGKPLAQNIPANSAGFIQMHYLNASDTDLMVHVDLKAYALDPGASYTPTAAYITYTKNFSVPPGTSTIQGSCQAPSGAKFWTLSSHTHKQGTEVKINDGSSMIYDSTDWEHPVIKDWNTTPFYTFSSNTVSWSCTYNNQTGATIQEGQSAATNEMCMATGYFFPASAPQFEVQLYNGTTSQGCFPIN
jgi:hypothetical protein